MNNITIKLNNEKNFTIKMEKYAHPVTDIGKAAPMIMNQWLYNALHSFAAQLGTTIDADETSGVDPITLVTDMLFYGPENFAQKVFGHATVKKWIRNEDTKHMADLACVLQWSGSGLGGDFCNVMFSSFNAIKEYVYTNWSKANVSKFWALID